MPITSATIAVCDICGHTESVPFPNERLYADAPPEWSELKLPSGVKIVCPRHTIGIVLNETGEMTKLYAGGEGHSI